MDDDEYLNTLMTKAKARTLADIAFDVRRYLSGAVENIINAGQALQEGRDMHPSKNAFHDWCVQEFPDLNKNTIYKLRNVAKKFSDRSLMIDHLSATVLYELAAPSVPDELVEDFMSSEEPVKVKDVKEAKESYKKVGEKGNEDLKDAVSSGKMKPREAAKKALSRSEEAVIEFNSLTDDQKLERLGGAEPIDAAKQRKLDESLGKDFNPINAATGILLFVNQLRLFGGQKEIEHHMLAQLNRSVRMQKYEAEALLMLADVINKNRNEIASFVETKPNLKLVN